MKKTQAILLGLCAVAFAGASVAAHSDHGLYADLGAGYGKVHVTGSGSDKQNRGFTGNANLGYQFSPHLAVEGGATKYRTILKVDNYNFHVAAKGIVGLNENVDAFAKAGAAYVHGIGTDAKSHQKIAPYLGAGLTYWVNDNLGATVQGEVTTKRGNAVPAMFGATAGLSYKFN